MIRFDHVRETRKRRAKIDEFGREIGLWGFSWRSWAKHPVANSVHRFWGLMPHAPKWDMESVTIGAVGHDGWSDPYVGGWLFVRCERCGMTRDTSLDYRHRGGGEE